MRSVGCAARVHCAVWAMTMSESRREESGSAGVDIGAKRFWLGDRDSRGNKGFGWDTAGLGRMCERIGDCESAEQTPLGWQLAALTHRLVSARMPTLDGDGPCEGWRHLRDAQLCSRHFSPVVGGLVGLSGRDRGGVHAIGRQVDEHRCCRRGHRGACLFQ